MFLTGQLFPRPWDEPESDQVIKKDSNFYNSSGVIQNNWNNPYRACKKVTNFFHDKEKLFRDTTYRDDEILKMDDDEKEQLRKIVLKRMRYQSQERMENRKLEREALSYKSKQLLSNPELNNEMEMIAQTDPVLLEELSLRRSNNFKDPSRPTTASVNDFKKYPTKQISKIIRPKILKMDNEGCENIKKRIEYERVIEQMEQVWKEENRIKIRHKFIQRHENNIEKERKAGIFKDYQTITDKSKRENGTRNRPFTTANLIRNRRLMSNQQKERMQTAITHEMLRTHTNKTGVFINDMDEFRGDKIISKRTEQSEAYQTIKNPTEPGDVNTIDRRNIDEIEKISSQNEHKDTDQLYETDDMDEQVNRQMEEMSFPNQFIQEQPEIEYYGAQLEKKPGSTNLETIKQASNEFRISYSRPKYPRRNITTERLAAPKKPAEVNNMFLYSDFRGMIHADNEDAIKNSNLQTPYYSTVSFNRAFTPNEGSQMGASQNLRGRRKPSEFVKEIFPVPEFNTYLSQPTKLKDRSKINKVHSSSKQFKTEAMHNMSGQAPSMQSRGMNFASSVNLPDLPENHNEVMKSEIIGMDSKQNKRTHTQQSQRKPTFDEVEKGIKEYQEIQESMKELDNFDRKFGNIKSKVGYPGINLKADLKIK